MSGPSQDDRVTEASRGLRYREAMHGFASLTRRLPWAPAFAGLLAAGAAIAASELVAGLVPGVPSLVTSVGGLVISLQPPGAKDVMVSLFGTNDKLVLNVAVVGLALAIGALAGVVAARRLEAGGAVFVAFGIVAAVAAARDPLASPAIGIGVAVLAVGAGLLTLRTLLRLAPGAPRRSPTTLADPDAAWTRRRFLIASAGTLGGVIVAGGAGRALVESRNVEGVVSTSKLPAPLVPVPPLAADQALDVPGLTPLVVPNDRFYRIDTALLVPQVNVASWELRVTGMVDRPLAFTYDELLEMPLYEQYVTIACVSNGVGGSLVGNALWTGVRLKDVLEAAGVQGGATQVVGRSVDGFTAGFPTAWAIGTGAGAPHRGRHEPGAPPGRPRLPGAAHRARAVRLRLGDEVALRDRADDPRGRERVLGAPWVGEGRADPQPVADRRP